MKTTLGILTMIAIIIVVSVAIWLVLTPKSKLPGKKPDEPKPDEEPQPKPDDAITKLSIIVTNPNGARIYNASKMPQGYIFVPTNNLVVFNTKTEYDEIIEVPGNTYYKTKYGWLKNVDVTIQKSDVSKPGVPCCMERVYEGCKCVRWKFIESGANCDAVPCPPYVPASN